MKKQIAIVVVLAVLLIGIAGASLVGFLSNIVTAEVQVNGPVFYLQEDTSSSDESLVLNDDSSLVEKDFSFLEGESILFISEPLGLDDNFYQAEFEINIWAKSGDDRNYLHFRILKGGEEICSVDSQTLSTFHFTRRIESCYSSGEITLSPSDKISLEISGVKDVNATSDNFEIRVGEKYSKGYSRVEVNKA